MKTLTLTFLLLVTSNLFAQQRVNENFEDIALATVFDLMEKNYQIKIAYDPALIVSIRITKRLENIPLEDAFTQILSGTELSFDRVKADYYSIRPSNIIWELSNKILNEDGEPVSFAKIRIIGSYKGTYADEVGNFELTHRSDQSPQLEITSLGYKKLIISADKLKNTTSIKLSLDVFEFPEIEVEYLTEGITISEDISSISIRLKKIGSVPGTTEPDVFQLVQNVPGINSASATVSEIQIRGGTSDQNHLLWDGIPIYHPGHFNGMISSINPNIIDRTELHTGIYDPYFGGKASGLIQLNSINYVPYKIETGAGINMMQGDAYVKMPLAPKVGLLISGRRSYMDLWKSPTYKRYSERVYQETEIQNTGLYGDEPTFGGQNVEQTEVFNDFIYYDINGKLIFKPNKNQLITVSGIYTANQLNYSSELLDETETNANYISSTNLGFSVNYDQIWSEKFKTSFVGALAQYRYAFSNDFMLTEPDEELFTESIEKSNAVNHYALKLNNRYTFNENHSISGGYQFLYNEVDYRLTSSEEEDSVSESGEVTSSTQSIHANYIFKNAKFITKIGGRLSYFGATESIYIEPRLYGQYRANDWLRIKVGAGIQNQFISQVDEFEGSELGLSNRIWVMTDDEEVPEVRSYIANIGAVAELNGWFFSVDGYIKELQGIVNFSDNAALSSGFVRGEASVKGIDLLIKKRWKNYRTWISYSFNEITYHFDDLDFGSFPAPFSQPHSINWVNTFSWRQFDFSSSFKLASGKSYSPIAGVETIEPTDPDEDAEFAINYGTRNSKRLPLFHQLDLTVYYNFPKNPEKNWRGKVGISCFNVYNNTNLLSRTYDLDIIEDEATGLDKFETYAVDKYYLFITPNAVIRFEF
ncbi:MAG: hypothetical protein ACI8ZM_002537 [Crocinitomix sp.]|jgi:hypothetical protein